jgi:ankyrin repeat protein
MAAKTLNLAELEDALEKDISPDTTDQYGNTLFILACQQGSKRLIKFLMRRGYVCTRAAHTC